MSDYRDRIAALAERARQHRESFEPPTDPPDEERAVELCREGLGPTVAVYLEARTGGPPVPFTEAEFVLLERALNDWLELYAACYDVDLDAEFTVREAAKCLLDTRDATDTARILTHVPSRGSSADRTGNKC